MSWEFPSLYQSIILCMQMLYFKDKEKQVLLEE